MHRHRRRPDSIAGQVVAPSRTSTTAVTLITLDVLPEEIGELPDSDSYVSIEVRAKRSR